MQVFLSYARKDSEFARKLAADLKSQGVDTWVDVAELQVGQDFQSEIGKAIRRADYLLVLISSDPSKWMMTEVRAALSSGEHRVIPVVIDERGKAEMPLFLRRIQWLDLSNPAEYNVQLNRFIDQIRRAEPLSSISSEEAIHDPAWRSPVRREEGRESNFAGINMDELIDRIAKEVAERIRPAGIVEKMTQVQGKVQANTQEQSKSVFVVMAFTDDMEPIYEDIRDAAKALGLEAKRVKDVVGDYQISNKLI